MSKTDRVKAEIGFHEKMFFVAFAAIIALIGWMVTNYITVDFWILAVSIVSLLGLCLFASDQYRRIKRLLEDLEKC